MRKNWFRLEGPVSRLLSSHERLRARGDYRFSSSDLMSPLPQADRVMREAKEDEAWRTEYFLRHQLNLLRVA